MSLHRIFNRLVIVVKNYSARSCNKMSRMLRVKLMAKLVAYDAILDIDWYASGEFDSTHGSLLAMFRVSVEEFFLLT
jgi:hypothetical protein